MLSNILKTFRKKDVIDYFLHLYNEENSYVKFTHEIRSVMTGFESLADFMNAYVIALRHLLVSDTKPTVINVDSVLTYFKALCENQSVPSSPIWIKSNLALFLLTDTASCINRMNDLDIWSWVLSDEVVDLCDIMRLHATEDFLTAIRNTNVGSELGVYNTSAHDFVDTLISCSRSYDFLNDHTDDSISDRALSDILRELRRRESDLADSENKKLQQLIDVISRLCILRSLSSI